MPPSCQPPAMTSSTPPCDKYLRPVPNGSSYMNDVVIRCRTSKTERPFSHSQQSPCWGFSGSPGARRPLPLSIDFEKVYDTRPESPFDIRRVTFTAKPL